jgi:DNA-directed RNA polymerase subunit beta
VGRYRINKKLGLESELSVRVLTKEDIIAIIRYLIELVNSKADVDDIDHLSNRRVRTVGEQLYAQFGVGLARMARTIRERMNVRDNEVFTPTDLINAKTLSSVINSFFGTNQLSAVHGPDQPAGRDHHKRRISALGPGGLSRERAGFEVRDVHYTHYGRLCTIETPEGPNIGLISLCVYHSKINSLGFIETPTAGEGGQGGAEGRCPIYLSAEEEDYKMIAQANAELNETGDFLASASRPVNMGDFPWWSPRKWNTDGRGAQPDRFHRRFADSLPGAQRRQPRPDGIEHDAPGRAAAPPEAPVVGTGLEAAWPATAACCSTPKARVVRSTWTANAS